MPKTTRYHILTKYKAAMLAIDRLDEHLYAIKILSQERNPAIEELGPMLLAAHEEMRKMWRELRLRL